MPQRGPILIATNRSKTYDYVVLDLEQLILQTHSRHRDEFQTWKIYDYNDATSIRDCIDTYEGANLASVYIPRWEHRRLLIKVHN